MRCCKALRTGRFGQRLASRNLGRDGLGGGFGGNDKLGKGARLLRLVLCGVLLITRGDLRLAGRGNCAERLFAEGHIADYAPFGSQVIGAVGGVVGVQLGRVRIALGRESGARQDGDGALAMLLEQHGVLPGNAGRHRRRVVGRDKHLPRVKARGNVVTDGFLAQPSLAKGGEERVAIELAVEALERLDLHQFAIDQALAGAQPLLAPVLRQGRPLQELFEHPVHAAGGKHAFHRQRRVLLFLGVELGGERLRKIRRADLAVADHGHAVACGNPA